MARQRSSRGRSTSNHTHSASGTSNGTSRSGSVATRRSQHSNADRLMDEILTPTRGVIGTPTRGSSRVGSESRRSSVQRILFSAENRSPRPPTIDDPEEEINEMDIDKLNVNDVEFVSTRPASPIEYFESPLVKSEPAPEETPSPLNLGAPARDSRPSHHNSDPEEINNPDEEMDSPFDTQDMNRLWCMHCLRSQVHDWATRYKNAECSLESFLVRCVFAERAQSRCVFCCTNKRTCETAAAMMSGDRDDLSLLLSFAHKFYNFRWDDEDDDGIIEFPLEDDERGLLLEESSLKRISRASFRLAETFSNAETQHRRHWNITGSKKSRANAQTAYDQAHESRQQGLNARVQPLPHNAPLSVMEQRESFLRSRLRSDDTGYASWQNAVASFKRDIAQALMGDSRGKDDEGEVEEWWMETVRGYMDEFPVALSQR
ncbi:hypothetical protein PT974_12573 [Cladobotryum mycophilum]|uniref:Uncharacterized protein n=1 Tax=Cladobotryum mycophilum TaxID=491253 RepID=A0ABR0S8C0_9HYPO